MTTGTRSQRDSYSRSEASSFLDDYSQHAPFQTIESPWPKAKAQPLHLVPHQNPHWRRRQAKLRDHVNRHLYIYRSLIPLLSSTLQITFLLYLLLTYLTLPPDPVTNQKPPRIAQRYSLWPFTSCVGSIRTTAYRVFRLTILTLNAISTTITLYRTRDDPVAWAVRRFNWLFTVVVYCLGIYSTLAASYANRALHLFLEAVHMCTIFSIRGTALGTDHLIHAKYPAIKEVWQVKVDTRWKMATLALGFPLGLVTNIAVFSCNYSISKIQTKGSTCHAMMAAGAICEWFYFLTNASWTASVAWEIYTAGAGDKVRDEVDKAEMRLLIEKEFGSEPASASSDNSSSSSRRTTEKPSMGSPVSHHPSLWKSWSGNTAYESVRDGASSTRPSNDSGEFHREPKPSRTSDRGSWWSSLRSGNSAHQSPTSDTPHLQRASSKRSDLWARLSGDTAYDSLREVDAEVDAEIDTLPRATVRHIV